MFIGSVIIKLRQIKLISCLKEGKKRLSMNPLKIIFILLFEKLKDFLIGGKS